MLKRDDVTPAIFCRDEEYWIHYVLRDLFLVFGRAVMLDTGSQDSTVQIAVETARELGASLTLIREDYGSEPNLIGNAPNVLRCRVSTDWMLLVGGDEIWRTDQLRLLLRAGMPIGKTVGMATGRNLVAKDGKLVERDGFSADRLFDRSVVWDKTDYPFEGHGLQNKVVGGLVQYIPVYFWHVRYLARSRRDDEVYFRRDKQDYFLWNGELKPVDDCWLGQVAKFDNPYKEILDA